MDRVSTEPLELGSGLGDSKSPVKGYPPDIYMDIHDLIVFVMDRDWKFHFIDERIEAVTGYPGQTFLDGGLRLLDIVHGEDRRGLERALEGSLQSDRYLAGEFRVLTREGKTKWLRIRGPISVHDDETGASIRGVINDITQRKQAEIALERERQIFISVVDNLEDGIYILSDDHQIRFMNQALIDLLNDEAGDEPYGTLERREDLFPWLALTAGRNESCGFEELHLPAQKKTFHVRSFPICSRHGSIGKVGQLKDITKIRKLERKLKDASLRVRAIAKAANMARLGIFILEDDEEIEGRFRFANEAFCRITGFARDELVKMSVADLVHPDDLQAVMDRYRRRLRGEELNDEYEMQMLQKDGTPIVVLFMGARTMHAGKLATVGFLRDITLRKELQKSLELSQRLASVGKLAAEIAHEINNPLTSILTFHNLVDKILDRQPFPAQRVSELQEYVRYANSEAKRCAEISRNLLNFSRNHEISVKDQDIREILEKTLDILRHRAELSAISLVTSYGEGIPRIVCDYHRIQQVFINLFWNALEAMPNGGILTVTTSFEPGAKSGMEQSESDGFVRITVSDTGMG
ncbi:MAG: PAS domain S-box protein, partial [Syntrophobacteraceae bacterium]|nr:PAS domain S-box protein [Syntrophobacteraceae bacterium]